MKNTICIFCWKIYFLTLRGAVTERYWKYRRETTVFFFSVSSLSNNIYSIYCIMLRGVINTFDQRHKCTEKKYCTTRYARDEGGRPAIEPDVVVVVYLFHFFFPINYKVNRFNRTDRSRHRFIWSRRGVVRLHFQYSIWTQRARKTWHRAKIIYDYLADCVYTLFPIFFF